LSTEKEWKNQKKKKREGEEDCTNRKSIFAKMLSSLCNIIIVQKHMEKKKKEKEKYVL
jgi:hypothetical protein